MHVHLTKHTCLLFLRKLLTVVTVSTSPISTQFTGTYHLIAGPQFILSQGQRGSCQVTPSKGNHNVYKCHNHKFSP